MKKLLLLTASAMLAASSAFAADAQPEEFPGMVFSAISPNGVWVVSSDATVFSVAVLNLETQEQWGYGSNFGTDEGYDAGIGHCISNDGVLVATEAYGGELPVYWKDGEWNYLPLQDTDYAGYPNAITPDGSRITGSVARMAMSLTSDEIMNIPVVWNRNADGEYDMYEVIDYPATDWTGRVPQYILPNDISADGKVIAATLVDYSGMANQPVCFTEGEDGKWSYSMLHTELLNPQGIELPENPGAEPKAPDPTKFMTDSEQAAYEAAIAAKADMTQPEATDFMTEEERQAYEEAYMAYLEDYFNNPYPYVGDYMTEEELAAWDAAVTEYWAPVDPLDYMNDAEKVLYNSAVEAYEHMAAVWLDKFIAFQTALDEIMESEGFVTYDMNSARISANGKNMIMSAYCLVPDPNNFISGYSQVEYPVLFNLADDSYVKMNKGQQDVYGNMVTDNAYVLGASPSTSYVRDAFLAKGADAPFEPVIDMIKEKDEALYDWVMDNMTHTFVDYEFFINDEGEFDYNVIEEDRTMLGTAVATDDFSVLVSWLSNEWDEYADVYFYSYILPIKGGLTGIKDVAITNANFGLTVERDGMLSINGVAANVTVYDINGRTVFTLDAPAAKVATGLSKGAYVVKATSVDGTVITKKAIF